MRVTFQESLDLSACEVYSLRQRAEDKAKFDLAIEWTIKQNFVANILTGTVRNKSGQYSQYVSYDWSSVYVENPTFIFHDFFMGALLNKYSRLIRGIDN